MKVSKNVGQWIGWFLLGLCLIVTYKIFDNLAAIGGVFGKFMSILTPFIVGFAIAFLLYAPVKKLDECFRRCKWKFMQRIARPLAVFIVYGKRIPRESFIKRIFHMCMLADMKKKI